jgi:hypothetical protein
MSSQDHNSRKNAAMTHVRLVEEVLRRWDPIGVQPGTFAPADEYDSYAPHIVSMVEHGCTMEELAGHLERLSAESMGVGSNLKTSQKFAAQIVRILRTTDSSM